MSGKVVNFDDAKSALRRESWPINNDVEKEFDAIKAGSAYLNLRRRSLSEFEAGVLQGWDGEKEIIVIA